MALSRAVAASLRVTAGSKVEWHGRKGENRATALRALFVSEAWLTPSCGREERCSRGLMRSQRRGGGEVCVGGGGGIIYA